LIPAKAAADAERARKLRRENVLVILHLPLRENGKLAIGFSFSFELQMLGL